MKRHVLLSTALLCLGLAISVSAQPLQDGVGKKGQKGPGGPRPPGQGGGMDSTSPIDRIMSLDANGDGVLTPAEVTDQRLQDLCSEPMQTPTVRSRSRIAGVVCCRVCQHGNGAGRWFRWSGNGTSAPEGGGMGRPRPGEVLPGFMMDQLQLTNEQRQQIAELQKQVDAQLAAILTDAGANAAPGTTGRSRWRWSSWSSGRHGIEEQSSQVWKTQRTKVANVS